ncbi:spore gernimation protein GerPD [Peribacillus cavernae]|uniref:Spore gernimation protein GerPD n=1 Tax=Peribacillus cavernae TaxID=1674310 RepID=A0A433HNU8_9BACI|nr:spore gernimation protein GerPD [Peribacillus cavernae]MDQ0217572.1 spore germination protein PD [Peribacillus cavernae]RUQ29994.1 spore gernimation protein GerPD [Peribacillus cavernae]
MEFNVTNCGLHVGNIEVLGVASASLFLIGDADTIQLSSAFDTPAESLIIGALVPFTPQG